MSAIEIMVTKIRPPLIRHHSEPLPKIIFTNADKENFNINDGIKEDSGDDLSDCGEDDDEFGEVDIDENTGTGRISFPEMTDALPEVTYGLKPRTAWMYRYKRIIFIVL